LLLPVVVAEQVELEAVELVVEVLVVIEQHLVLLWRQVLQLRLL
jgi:hypothetical protein